MSAPVAGDDDAAVARTLQRGLAPDQVPTFAGLQISGRYRAGGVGDVGGDWYDVLDLGSDGVGLVVGDVAGRGIGAATTMGQLRFAIRAYLLDDRDPASVLSRLNRLVLWLLPGTVATAVIAVVSSDRSRATLASAGHPPVLHMRDGAAGYPEVVRGPALGLQANAGYGSAVIDLDPGSGLLLYTDGLVERRGESIDDGFARLAQTATRYFGDAVLLDRLLESAPGDDDVAILALSRLESG